MKTGSDLLRGLGIDRVVTRETPSGARGSARAEHADGHAGKGTFASTEWQEALAADGTIPAVVGGVQENSSPAPQTRHGSSTMTHDPHGSVGDQGQSLTGGQGAHPQRRRFADVMAEGIALAGGAAPIDRHPAAAHAEERAVSLAKESPAADPSVLDETASDQLKIREPTIPGERSARAVTGGIADGGERANPLDHSTGTTPLAEAKHGQTGQPGRPHEVAPSPSIQGQAPPPRGVQPDELVAQVDTSSSVVLQPVLGSSRVAVIVATDGLVEAPPKEAPSKEAPTPSPQVVPPASAKVNEPVATPRPDEFISADPSPVASVASTVTARRGVTQSELNRRTEVRVADLMQTLAVDKPTAPSERRRSASEYRERSADHPGRAAEQQALPTEPLARPVQHHASQLAFASGFEIPATPTVAQSARQPAAGPTTLPPPRTPSVVTVAEPAAQPPRLGRGLLVHEAVPSSQHLPGESAVAEPSFTPSLPSIEPRSMQPEHRPAATPRDRAIPERVFEGLASFRLGFPAAVTHPAHAEKSPLSIAKATTTTTSALDRPSRTPWVTPVPEAPQRQRLSLDEGIPTGTSSVQAGAGPASGKPLAERSSTRSKTSRQQILARPDGAPTPTHHPRTASTDASSPVAAAPSKTNTTPPTVALRQPAVVDRRPELATSSSSAQRAAPRSSERPEAEVPTQPSSAEQPALPSSSNARAAAFPLEQSATPAVLPTPSGRKSADRAELRAPGSQGPPSPMPAPSAGSLRSPSQGTIAPPLHAPVLEASRASGRRTDGSAHSSVLAAHAIVDRAAPSTDRVAPSASTPPVIGHAEQPAVPRPGSAAAVQIRSSVSPASLAPNGLPRAHSVSSSPSSSAAAVELSAHPMAPGSPPTVAHDVHAFTVTAHAEPTVLASAQSPRALESRRVRAAVLELQHRLLPGEATSSAAPPSSRNIFVTRPPGDKSGAAGSFPSSSSAGQPATAPSSPRFMTNVAMASPRPKAAAAAPTAEDTDGNSSAQRPRARTVAPVALSTTVVPVPKPPAASAPITAHPPAAVAGPPTRSTVPAEPSSRERSGSPSPLAAQGASTSRAQPSLPANPLLPLATVTMAAPHAVTPRWAVAPANRSPLPVSLNASAASEVTSSGGTRSDLGLPSAAIERKRDAHQSSSTGDGASLPASPPHKPVVDLPAIAGTPATPAPAPSVAVDPRATGSLVPQLVHPLLDLAAADPSLHASALGKNAHVRMETAKDGDLSLHLTVHDGVVDVRFDGAAARTLDLRPHEVRAALAGEGISLGTFESATRATGSTHASMQAGSSSDANASSGVGSGHQGGGAASAQTSSGGSQPGGGNRHSDPSQRWPDREASLTSTPARSTSTSPSTSNTANAQGEPRRRGFHVTA